MNIIILGPPASGKGVQSEKISKTFDLCHIAVGEVLRQEIANKTEIGNKLAQYMNKGKLAPDSIVCTIVKEKIKQCKKGILFDGFPRTIKEAHWLDKNAEINHVIQLDVQDEIAIERISSRRECLKCAKVYGKNITPKKKEICDDCGSKLIQREDDKPEVIKKRLEIYHDESEPLLEYYRPRDIVKRIDGTREAEEVFKKILKSLE